MQFNLIPNGDFDLQNGAAPTTGSNNVKSPYASPGDVANWESTNYSSPDYYATNAPAGSAANPASAARGAFTPYPGPNAINGCIGLYSFDNGYSGADRYTEYVTQTAAITLNGGAEYYVTLQAYKASAAPDATYATYVGIDLVPSTSLPSSSSSSSLVDYSYTTSPGFTPRLFTPGSFGAHALVSERRWTPITGTFKPTQGGQFYVNIGNFQQANPANPPRQTQVYHYVDAAGLYEIPTAGPAVTTCPGVPVTIGTGCGVPGAAYTWSSPGGPTISPGSPQIRVQPPATTTYTLTVTLPNGATRTSSVTVTVAAAPSPVVALTDNNTCAQTATYSITNYNPAYTYTVTPSSSDFALQQSNPVGATFSLRATSTATRGSFTLTLSGCGTTTTTTYIDLTPPAPGGYFYVASDGNSNPLRTYQFLNITNYQGADIGMFITNTPYTFSFSSDLPGLYLTNTTGTATHFILKPGQGTTITVTALNSPCPMRGQYAFIASSTGYSYRVAPNPVSEELTVTAVEEAPPADAASAATSTAAPASIPLDADLYDRFGHKVKSKHDDHGKAVVDVRDLPEGLYELRVGKGKNALTERIQVTH